MQPRLARTLLVISYLLAISSICHALERNSWHILTLVVDRQAAIPLKDPGALKGNFMLGMTVRNSCPPPPPGLGPWPSCAPFRRSPVTFSCESNKSDAKGWRTCPGWSGLPVGMETVPEQIQTTLKWRFRDIVESGTGKDALQSVMLDVVQIIPQATFLKANDNQVQYNSSKTRYLLAQFNATRNSGPLPHVCNQFEGKGYHCYIYNLTADATDKIVDKKEFATKFWKLE